MPQPAGLQFTARIANLPDDTFAVVDFRLEENFSTPFTLTLNLASTFSSVVVTEALDKAAELSVWQDGELQRRVQGIVYAFERGETGHRRTLYKLIVVPALERLSLMRNSRIFQQQDSQQIIQTLLTERGLVESSFNLQRQPEEREYCVQHRETDLDFLQRLAAEEGWHYRFDTATSGQPLVLADHHRDAPQLPSVAHNANAGGSSRQACVFRFQHQEKLAAARASLRDYTFKNPAYDLAHDDHARGIHHRDDYEHYDYPGRYKKDASGKPFSRNRLDGLRNESNVAQGESNRADFTAGARIKITDHTHEPHNQNWLITNVIHTGEQPQAAEEEGGSGATTYNNDFQVIPGNQSWRPNFKDKTRPRMDGPQIATVTGPPGEEIHCDKHGRVKVRFPWDRRSRPGEVESSRNDEHSSAWIRVSQSWAGAGYGFMAIPRIGHEVIVSFLDGDPDQPIITGRTYHAANTPPYPLPENKTRTVLKTQSHGGPGHNELSFEDQHQEELVYLRAQKDHQLEIRNDQTFQIGRDRTRHIGNDQRLDVGRDEFSEIKRDQSLKVGQDQRLEVTRDRFTNIGRHYRMEVADQRKDISHANHDLEVGGHYSQKVQGKVLVEAGESALIHTKNLTLNGSETVVIQGPSGKITIDGSGVRIDAPSIKLNGPVAVATGSVSPLRTLKSAAEEGTPLVDICGDCGEGL